MTKTALTILLFAALPAVADEVDQERPRLDFGLAGNAVDGDRDVQGTPLVVGRW